MRTYHCGSRREKRVPRHQRSWTVGRCDLPAVPRHQIRGGGGTIIIRSAASLTGQVRLMVKFKSYDVNILSTTATAGGGSTTLAPHRRPYPTGWALCVSQLCTNAPRPLGRRHLAAKSFGTVPCDRRNVRRRETIRVSKQSSMGVSKGHVSQNATNVLCDGSLRESRPHEKYWLLRFHVSTRGSPGRHHRVRAQRRGTASLLAVVSRGNAGQIHQAWGWRTRSPPKRRARILLVVQKATAGHQTRDRVGGRPER